MEDRAKSGITGLDELITGGFPKGGTYAVVGYAGTGKSIFSFQFLFKGAADYDEPGVYVILEEEKDRMVGNMKSLGWDVDKLEAQGKIKIVPYMKSIVGDVEATFERGMMSGENTRTDRLRQYLTVDSLFREIEQSCRSIGAKRVVIDSLTVITLLAENQLMSRMQLLWLIEKLRKLNVTTILTLEEGIGFWRDMLFLCDGIIYMMLKEKSGIFERGMIVEKMRGTRHDTGMRPLKITDGGIIVYPSELMLKDSSKH